MYSEGSVQYTNMLSQKSIAQMLLSALRAEKDHLEHSENLKGQQETEVHHILEP